MSTISVDAVDTAAPEIRYSLWDLVAYFIRLGTWGIGGPVLCAAFAGLLIYPLVKS